jgi:hypothetical protein
MLKKSFALGLLAAFALAPAAFAGSQTQGNVTNTVIRAGNVGEGNVTGITNSTSVRQTQGKKGQNSYWCSGSAAQVQGNATNTAIAASNVGIANVTGITNATKVRQRQAAKSGC